MGLGPSISDYQGEPGRRFGSNDVFRFYQVEELVIQNFPDEFTPERRAIIRGSTPEIFHVGLDETLHPGRETWGVEPARKMELLSPRGTVDFSQDRIGYSLFSSFSCLDLAIRSGASRILVFGIDLVDHPVMGQEKKLIRVLSDLEGLLRASPVPVHWAGSSPLAPRLASSLASSGGGALPSRSDFR